MLSTVTPSSTTWIRPFARTQVDHSKRPTEYHRRTGRPGKTTDEEPVAMQKEEMQSTPMVQESVPEAQSFPLANDVIMEDICRQDREQRSSQKSVLVPAVDNSGQEILLHVEYTTLDEASLGNNLQSLPLPTASPMGQSYSTTMPTAQDFTSALSGMQNISTSSATLASSAEDVSAVSSLVQTSPMTASTMEIPVAPSLMQTLPVSSSVAQPSVTMPACVQNHRREGPNSRKHGLPWWKHSNTPSTTKIKEIPPLAPIAVPRKIFKSRNTASASNNVCSGMDGVVGMASSGVHTSRSDTFLSSQQHQQLIGSNGSQQLVFVVPQSPPKQQQQQQVVLQQPEVPAVSQDMIGQLIPMAQAPSADDSQHAAASMLLQATVQNTMQTPILLLTSDGRLLQVVQQPS
ncbi:hypothetical protein MTO96_012546 [Rhipicephalus appendiculatus]